MLLDVQLRVVNHLLGLQLQILQLHLHQLCVLESHQVADFVGHFVLRILLKVSGEGRNVTSELQQADVRQEVSGLGRLRAFESSVDVEVFVLDPDGVSEAVDALKGESLGGGHVADVNGNLLLVVVAPPNHDDHVVVADHRMLVASHGLQPISLPHHSLPHSVVVPP